MKNLLLFIFHKNKKTSLTLILLSFFINILMFSAPLYTMSVYDKVLSSYSLLTLFMLFGITTFCIICFGLFDYIRTQILLHLSYKIDQSLSEYIFQVSYQNSNKKSEYPPSFDLNIIRDFISSNALTALIDAPWIIIFILFAYLIHPYLGTLTLISAFIVLTIACINRFTTSQKIKESNQMKELEKEEYMEIISQSEETKIMGMGKDLQSKWNKTHQKSLKNQLLSNFSTSHWNSLLKAIRIFIQILVMSLAAWLVMQGEISAGSIMALTMISSRALQPLETIVSQWPQISTAQNSAKRLNNFIQKIDINKEKNILKLPNIKGNIDIKNLTIINPENQKPILDDISFSLKSGEILAIIGPSGSGKSTLLKSILGIVEITNGSIRIDNAELNQYDWNHHGKQIGYLSQEIKILNGTIAQNISRFQENPDENEILEASQKTDTHKLILELPDGYQTLIGEKGIPLSGGQKQRISLAKTFFKNPNLIILDEPNANLDQYGEQALYQTLKEAKKNKTTIIFTTHRTGLLNIADKICVLQNGKIKNFGDKEKIINQSKDQRN